MNTRDKTERCMWCGRSEVYGVMRERLPCVGGRSRFECADRAACDTEIKKNPDRRRATAQQSQALIGQMKTEVGTTTKLEMQIINGPRTLLCQGFTIKLEEHDDAAVLMMTTLMGSTIMAEQIVAVTTDVAAALRLWQYVRLDGGIGLGRGYD